MNCSVVLEVFSISVRKLINYDDYCVSFLPQTAGPGFRRFLRFFLPLASICTIETSILLVINHLKTNWYLEKYFF